MEPMRWLLASLFFSLATPIFAQDAEAEKLFRAMEKKVREAKSVKVAMALAFRTNGADAVLKGSYISDEGNKSKLELAGAVEGKAVSIAHACNGEMTYDRTRPGEGL